MGGGVEIEIVKVMNINVIYVNKKYGKKITLLVQ
jgi:hypothetical protein